MSPGLEAPGRKPLDDLAVMARRNEADVLAVGLLGVEEAEPARQLAHLRLWHLAERKAQPLELRARGGEQEIALVALGIGGAIERSARHARHRGR